MDLWDIAKTVGSEVITKMVPGGAAMLATLNAFLPPDKRLPDNATGTQVDQAINQLTPTEKATLLKKKYDVDIAKIRQGNATLRAMLDSEARSPHSTRPAIAMGCFLVLAFFAGCIAAAIVWCVVHGQTETLAAMEGLTLLIGSVTVTFAYVLKAYFGILSQESRDKQNAANGFQNTAALSSLVGALKK